MEFWVIGDNPSLFFSDWKYSLFYKHNVDCVTFLSYTACYNRELHVSPPGACMLLTCPT